MHNKKNRAERIHQLLNEDIIDEPKNKNVKTELFEIFEDKPSIDSDSSSIGKTEDKKIFYFHR